MAPIILCALDNSENPNSIDRFLVLP
jgi:hypothetical protein